MLAWLVAFAMFRAYTNKQLGKAGRFILPALFSFIKNEIFHFILCRSVCFFFDAICKFQIFYNKETEAIYFLEGTFTPSIFPYSRFPLQAAARDMHL